jgi:thiol-disulfide isomerase/thioredoxin
MSGVNADHAFDCLDDLLKFTHHSVRFSPKPHPIMKTTFRSLACLFLAILGTTLVSASAETRQWTNAEGKSITGELKGVAGDKAAILTNGRVFNIPLASLSEADRAFIAEWQATKGSGPADPAKAYDTPTMKALEKSLVKLDGRRIGQYTLENPEKIEVIAFYSSASWCGPCHAFTPDLNRAYQSLKKKYDNFELVLLTADREKEAWEGYLKEYKMPFPSVDYDATEALGTLRSGNNSNFIPAIHIVARDGTVLDDASAGARASLEKLEGILKERANKGT